MKTSVPRAVVVVVLETDCPFCRRRQKAQIRKGPEHQRASHSAHKNCIQSNLLLFLLLLLPAHSHKHSGNMYGMHMIIEIVFKCFVLFKKKILSCFYWLFNQYSVLGYDVSFHFIFLKQILSEV